MIKTEIYRYGALEDYQKASSYNKDLYLYIYFHVLLSLQINYNYGR